MKGTKEFLCAIRAGYSYFHVQTQEMNRAVNSLMQEIKEFTDSNGNNQYQNIEIWDYENGKTAPEKVQDMMLEKDKIGTVILAKNLDWFLDPQGGYDKDFRLGFTQMLQNNLNFFSSSSGRKVLVIFSDKSVENSIPSCLQKDFLSIELGLPDEAEIKEVYDNIINSAKEKKEFEIPNEKAEKEIINCCKGMSKLGVGNALVYSIIKDGGKILPKTVSMLQAKEVEKTPGLKIGNYDDIDDVIGYENIINFVLNTIESKHSLGILILGPTGTGKTHLCKYISKMVKKKLIEMEIAQMSGEGLVGQMENAWKKGIDVTTANSPCILLIDKHLSI